MKYLFILSVLLMGPLETHANIYSRNTWEVNEVTTCFADAEKTPREEGPYVLKVRDWKDKDKEKLEAWVKEEYTPERTGIHFTGFLDCEDAPDADVIIFKNKNSKLGVFFFGGLNGLALLGPYENEVVGYPKARSFVSISNSGMNKGTVIHEFGHVAALSHEHDHPDAYKEDKSGCTEINDHSYPKYHLEYEPYDKDSVMNYCRIHGKGGKKIGLSERDVELLKRLYP